MAFKPITQLLKSKAPRRYLNNNPLNFVQRGVYFLTIQHQKGFHGGMAASLVAIYKGMVLDNEKADGRGLGFEGGIEIVAVKGHAGLGYG